MVSLAVFSSSRLLSSISPSRCSCSFADLRNGNSIGFRFDSGVRIVHERSEHQQYNRPCGSAAVTVSPKALIKNKNRWSVAPATACSKALDEIHKI